MNWVQPIAAQMVVSWVEKMVVQMAEMKLMAGWTVVNLAEKKGKSMAAEMVVMWVQ